MNKTAIDADFGKLVEPHRMRLRLHCYRMLGSSHDADDMVQETLARAFRSRESLASPDTVRPWLYRIATNVCLDELQKRPNKPRARGPELGPPGDPTLPPVDVRPDDEWIEPMPISAMWLEEETALARVNVTSASPAAQFSVKESVALAFVAALQVLTPAQRAVLLLRDVVGLSAEETAEALESTVSAANSTLHRARVALETRVGPRASWSPDQDAPVDRALLERYVRAWETGDLDVIISLLHEEATLSMPPLLAWFEGREAAAAFFTTRLKPALDAKVFRTKITEANGLPAICFYRRSEADPKQYDLHAINVLRYRDGKIVYLDHFMTPSSLAPFIASGIDPVVVSD